MKDRLAAYFYWEDPRSLEQARLVAENHPIDFDNITTWAKKEGFSAKLQIFFDSLE